METCQILCWCNFDINFDAKIKTSLGPRSVGRASTVRILMLTLTFYFLFSFQTDNDFGKIVILKEYLRTFLHYYFQN